MSGADIDPKDDDQLLSLAAHEFRSPASALTGYLRLLLQGHAGELTDAQRKMVENANRSCGRILNLVHELSDLAALKGADSPTARRPVPIFSLCDDLVRAAVDQT